MQTETIQIHTEFIKLQDLLKFAGDARIAPQMNMFVVGMQLKIFVGIFVILFTIGMLPAVSNFILEEIQSIFTALVRGMS